MGARVGTPRHRRRRRRVSKPSGRSLRRGWAIGSPGFATLGIHAAEGHRLPDPVLGDAYAILGVKPGSDDETIAAAYRSLARQHHPDIAGEAGTARMIRLNAAFDRVRTADRRAAYDLEGGRVSARRASWAPEFDGTGGAGPAPGRPTGSVLDFGRHLGWSIGEIARVDPGYLLWLEDRREGQPFLEEIDRTLRAVGIRRETEEQPASRSRGRRR